MNQYRRIVSYLYQYLNGDKGQNTGYVKLEQKARQCRITVQMRAFETSYMPEVWLFKQEPACIEYVPIGRLSAYPGNMQAKVVTNADDVCASGHPASDFDGVVIYISNKEYYATTWTNESIYIGEKVNMLGRKEIHRDSRISDNYSKDKIIVERSNNSTSEDTIENIAERVMDRTVNINPVNRTENISQTDKKEETGSIDNTGKADSFASTSKTENTDQADEENKEDSTDNADQPDSNKIPNENNVDSGSKTDVYATQVNTSGADVRTQDIREEDFPDLQPDGRSGGQPGNQPVYGCSACPYRNTSKKNEDFGMRILKDFPVMYPFRSGEIEESVRIEPKDIGCMPIRLWSFANNRFLLHGYYCYKHLIFAKLHSGGYALGVPGIYSEQESRKAEGYSFKDFQAIGPGKKIYGVFGYWMAKINV